MRLLQNTVFTVSSLSVNKDIYKVIYTSNAGLTVNVSKVTRFIHLLFQRKEEEATLFIYNRCLNTQVRKDREQVHIQRKQ